MLCTQNRFVSTAQQTGQSGPGSDDTQTATITANIMKLSPRLLSSFPALVTRGKTPATVETLTRTDLPSSSTVKSQPGECDLVVKVQYSTLNYKDALVVTGK